MFALIQNSIVRVFSSVVLGSVIVGLGLFALLIGFYNYDRSIEELQKKASSTADLAAFSLVEPIWNFDDAALQGIANAIMMDSDMQAIRVIKNGSDTPDVERVRPDLSTTFEALQKNPSNLLTSAKIMRQGEEIATVQLVTSTDKVLSMIRYTSMLIAAFAVALVALLSGFIWWLGRQIIQRPINSLRKSADELASGNLNFPINTRRSDELGSLAKSFDKMRHSIRQMLAVIEEQNRTLEERILIRTAELRQKTNDINSMLQNMRQGIFTVVPGGLIHPEYSSYLGEIFETQTIAAQSACGLLFADSDVQGDSLSQVEATLDALIGEEAMNFEFNSHLLVTSYSKTFADGRQKILELDWNPVLDAEGYIDKMMVTVRDVTEFKALQMETERQKEQLEIIGQILSVSQEKLVEFVDTSYAFMDENQALIEATPEKDLDVVATLFRNMHTIKGNARTYGFSYVTDRVHEAETAYSLLRTHNDYVWSQQELLSQLQAARACVARYESVFQSKLAGYTEVSTQVHSKVLEKMVQAVECLNESSELHDYQNSFHLLRAEVNSLKYESVENMLKGIVAALPSIAQQLDKEVPTVDVQDQGIMLKKEIVPVLKNVFMHIFRNSMDHGLESKAARVVAGKPAAGHIRVQVSKTEEALQFEFADDGRGLALDHIYAKAVSEGKVDPEQAISDEAIAELIFLSGLSTAKTLTDVSGRGVGMDAVRQFLHKHFGDIAIVFTGPALRGFRPFQLRITLPPALGSETMVQLMTKNELKRVPSLGLSQNAAQNVTPLKLAA
jgi:HAMP domain-containing protein/HPt (histidine-containing phosphotransfer) domain-containing protein